jgi:hypothetical protein
MIANRRFLTWPRVSLLVLAPLLAGGCDAASSYRTIVRQQTRAREEMAKILSTVSDKTSMQAARAQLNARFDDFESIRQRAQELPPPTQDVLRQVQEDGEKLGQALEKIQDQVRRINSLPEGADFLASFEHMKGFLGDRAP